MTNSEQAIREFAVNNGHRIYFTDGDMDGFDADPRFISDLTALISEHYVSREEYKELLQQRDELKDSLVDMVNQFAYRGTYEGRENMHTGGLSALEDAFAALGLSDPITLIDFYAAIKNTER